MRRTERAWLFGARGYCLGPAPPYLELIPPELPSPLVYLIVIVGCVFLCILQSFPPPPRSGSGSGHRSAGIAPVWGSSRWSQLSSLCPPVTVPSFAFLGHLAGVAVHVGSTHPAHITANGPFINSPVTPSALPCVSCRGPDRQISSEWKAMEGWKQSGGCPRRVRTLVFVSWEERCSSPPLPWSRPYTVAFPLCVS